MVGNFNNYSLEDDSVRVESSISVCKDSFVGLD